MATDQQLLDLDGVSRRASAFVYEVLDASLNLTGRLYPDADSAPSVSVSSGRSLARTMSGLKLPGSVAGALNPYSDRVRPVMVLENGSRYPLGVFLAGDASTAIGAAVSTVEASFIDQAFVVDQPIARGFSVPPGSDLTAAMTSLLSGLVPSYVVDSAGVSGTSAMSWPAGTSQLAILNAIGKVCGFWPLYFDNAGVGRMTAVRDYSAATADVTYTNRAFADTKVESNDLLDAPNRYLVVDTAATTETVGVYDVPASAPFSYAARGFYVTKAVTMQGVGSVAVATRAAQALAQTDAHGYVVQFQGPPDPRHDVHSAVGYKGEVWQETSWSMTLREGEPMKHELHRAYA